VFSVVYLALFPWSLLCYALTKVPRLLYY